MEIRTIDQIIEDRNQVIRRFENLDFVNAPTDTVSLSTILADVAVTASRMTLASGSLESMPVEKTPDCGVQISGVASPSKQFLQKMDRNMMENHFYRNHIRNHLKNMFRHFNSSLYIECSELLQYDDAKFVDNLYQKLLYREPDEKAKQDCLRALRTFQATKLDLINAVQNSDEGRMHYIYIKGLTAQTLKHRAKNKIRNIPVIGYCIRWINALLLLPRYFSEGSQTTQNLQNAIYQLQECNFEYVERANQIEKKIYTSLGGFSAQIKQLDVCMDKISLEFNERIRQIQDKIQNIQSQLDDIIYVKNKELGTKLEYLSSELLAFQKNQKDSNSHFVAATENLDLQISAFRNKQQEYQESLEKELSSTTDMMEQIFQKRYEEVKEEFTNKLLFMEEHLTKKVTKLEGIKNDLLNREHLVLEHIDSQNKLYDMRVRRVERKLSAFLELKNIKIKSPEDQLPSDSASNNDLDYFLFENKFRGSIEDIKDRQKIYVDVYKNADFVVDLGCGRGEFVELMKEHSIRIEGIDMSEDNVQLCQEKQLPVYRREIFEYLSEAHNNSIGGIFCSQVVEHFTTEQLLNFVQLSYRKLEVNAPIVIETINPQNVVAVSNWFYMDLTHVRPVHPETLKFILESYGFYVKEIKFLHPDTVSMLPELKNPDESEFNAKLGRLNECLFGPQDYAVIAYKMSETKDTLF